MIVTHCTMRESHTVHILIMHGGKALPFVITHFYKTRTSNDPVLLAKKCNISWVYFSAEGVHTSNRHVVWFCLLWVVVVSILPAVLIQVGWRGSLCSLYLPEVTDADVKLHLWQHLDMIQFWGELGSVKPLPFSISSAVCFRWRKCLVILMLRFACSQLNPRSAASPSFVSTTKKSIYVTDATAKKIKVCFHSHVCLQL